MDVLVVSLSGFLDTYFLSLDDVLNFRTRLSESIYLFFNKKYGYFVMQVATVPHKLAATR